MTFRTHTKIGIVTAVALLLGTYAGLKYQTAEQLQASLVDPENVQNTEEISSSEIHTTPQGVNFEPGCYAVDAVVYCPSNTNTGTLHIKKDCSSGVCSFKRYAATSLAPEQGIPAVGVCRNRQNIASIPQFIKTSGKCVSVLPPLEIFQQCSGNTETCAQSWASNFGDLCTSSPSCN